jgi:hypothetical protein
MDYVGLDMYRELKKIEFPKEYLESTRPRGRPRNR